MNVTDTDLHKRLLYILHLGLVEIRDLALACGHERIADLADAMEILPGLVDKGGSDELDLIRNVLKGYQEKYQSNYDFPRRFEEYQVPERF
jgi:hypothetical protein